MDKYKVKKERSELKETEVQHSSFDFNSYSIEQLEELKEDIEDQIAIKRGRASFEKHPGYTHEEAKELTKKWLREL